MKTHKILFFAAGLLLLSCLQGCEKQLDIQQHGSIGVDEFYQTDADAESAVANLYCVWRGSFGHRMFLFSLLSDDSMRGGSSSNKYAPFAQMASWTFNSGCTYVRNYYEDCYAIIYASNLIIDNITPDTDVKKQVVAEAKFFRGYSHLHLAALWGETVPMVDHLLAPDEYHVTNSQPGEVWNLVESDLKDAIAVLPSKQGLGDKTVTRVTKEAAEVYLGKAYLWQKKYSEARKEFEKVIDSNLYDLWDGNFEDMVHVATNNNCEKVLEAYVPEDSENMRANGISSMNGGNGYLQMAGFYFSFFKASNDAKKQLATGDGWFPPRKGLYNAFVAEEGENGYRLNASIKTIKQMNDLGFTYEGKDMWCTDGFINWKNRILNADLVGGAPTGRSANTMFINYCYVRFAEVLLLAAEANLRASDGSQAKADNYVNRVRRRAKLSDKSNVTLDDIKTEKRLELCFEGVRYMDLIRWQRIEGTHDAYNAMKDQDKEVYHIHGVQTGQDAKGNPVYQKDNDGNVVWEQYLANKYDGGFKEGKHELLPYPLEEMDVNGSYINQNPNWD